MNRPFWFKVVCLIEISPKFIQEKSIKFMFSIYVAFTVYVE